MKKCVWLIGVVLLLCKGAEAQDIHFSQFYNAPLLLNPANTGLYRGDWQIVNNYKRQWASLSVPYVTIDFAFDRQLFFHSENFSVGFVFLSDRSGDASLTINKFYLSSAYHKKFGAWALHGGLMAGYAHTSFNPSTLTFPDQYDPEQGQFNNKLPNYENFNLQSISYFDCNAGFIAQRNFKNISPLVGISFDHLNRANQGFFSDNRPAAIRSNFHASVKCKFNKYLFAIPDFMSSAQNGASYILAGSRVGSMIPKNKLDLQMIYAGFMLRTGIYRPTDAYVVTTGLQIGRFKGAFSYDINVSDLSAATNYQGGFEISLIYTSISTNPSKIALSCERD